MTFTVISRMNVSHVNLFGNGVQRGLGPNHVEEAKTGTTRGYRYRRLYGPAR